MTDRALIDPAGALPHGGPLHAVTWPSSDPMPLFSNREAKANPGFAAQPLRGTFQGITEFVSGRR